MAALLTLIMIVSFSLTTFASENVKKLKELEIEAYCKWQKTQGRAKASNLASPKVKLSRFNVEKEDLIQETRQWKNMAQVKYGLNQVRKAFVTTELSNQECLKYQGQSVLEEIIALGIELGHYKSYRKQLTILKEGLIHLQQMETRLKEKLSKKLISIQVFLDFEFKISTLRNEIQKVNAHIHNLENRGAPAKIDIAQALRKFVKADTRIKELDNKMISLSSWDISAGITYFENSNKDHWEGSISLTFPLGFPVQKYYLNKSLNHYKSWGKFAPEKLVWQIKYLKGKWKHLLSEQKQKIKRYEGLNTLVQTKINELDQIDSPRARKILYDLLPKHYTIRGELAFSKEYVQFLTDTKEDIEKSL